MSRTTKIDGSRRAFLLRLGLAAGAAYVAPLMTRLSHARASSASFSGAGTRRRVQRPEIVVSTPLAADIDRIAAEGFALLSRGRLTTVNAEIARFRVPPRFTFAQARTRILQLVPSAVIDINHVYRTSELPCDADSCAAFEMIGWKTAAHACPAGTTIGMIDTAINLRHEALKNIDVAVHNVIADGRRMASTAHGTAIAALLAGRSDSPTPGILRGVRIVAAQAFHRDARGQDTADAFDIARALDLLVAESIRVINLSFVGPENAVLRAVVSEARTRDVVMVAAAGNDGPRAAPRFPAAYDGVVAVTAIDRMKRVYRQANSGAHIDFSAPGVRLWTASDGRTGRFRSGTSYAVPFVSAALAVARIRAPRKTVDELVSEMAGRAIDLGQPGRDTTFGWGLAQFSGECVEMGSITFPPAAGG